MRDEYLAQELQDACDAIAWLARQPWCSPARVGMIGNSWARLQRAPGRGAPAAGPRRRSSRPAPPTTATPTTCTTWAAACSRTCSTGARRSRRCSRLPPDPALVGDRWREMWRDAHRRAAARLVDDLAPPPAPRCVLEARLGQRGLRARSSARSSPSAAGSTATRNAIPRLLAASSCPRRGVIGPWAHAYPAPRRRPGRSSTSSPSRPLVRPLAEGPRHGDHARADAPGLDGRGHPRGAVLSDGAGRWVAEPVWPSPRITTQRSRLDGDRLSSAASPCRARRGVPRVVVARHRRASPVASGVRTGPAGRAPSSRGTSARTTAAR